MTALRQNPAAGISAVPRRKSALLSVLPVEEVELVCLAAHEPGGPRRCSGDARHSLERSTSGLAALLERLTELDAPPADATPATVMGLPGTVQEAVDVAAEVGHPFIVGGAVRDALLGRVPHDFDLEVHGSDLDELAGRFAAAGWEVDEVGRQFGVLKVSRAGQDAIDVTVPRRENKIGAGHRGFSVDIGGPMSVADAAARRDFTINAIYYDRQADALVDPFGGAADLDARVLRHVSDAFSEDPLRVLRGVQFAGRFAMTIHPDTAALCRRLRPQFDELATERVQLEWAKLYTSANPEMAAAALHTTGWDDTIPGLKAALAQPQIAAALARLPAVPEQDRVAVGAAVIGSTMSTADRRTFLDTTVVGKEAAVIAEDLTGAAAADLGTSAARKHHAYGLAKRGFTFTRYMHFAHALGDPAGAAAARAAVEEGLGDGPEPAWIQGRDVLAAAGGRKPGPWVGELVAAALQRQYRGEFPGRPEALTWLVEAAGTATETNSSRR